MISEVILPQPNTEYLLLVKYSVRDCTISTIYYVCLLQMKHCVRGCIASTKH